MSQIGKNFKSFQIASSQVEIKRTEEGVVHIRAENSIGIQRGLGFAHAHDRFLQLILSRVLANGKLSQYLFDTEEAFGIDFTIRKLGLSQDVVRDIINLTPEAHQWCEAYCEGINTYLDRFGPPFLCKVLKMDVAPWRIEDTLLLIKMQMYLGLAQAQERTERFILQAIHDGVSVDHLKKLFSPHLEHLDQEGIILIKSVPLGLPYLGSTLQFAPAFSNSWALSSKKSVSGLPLCASDPHLQVNRLPAVWYEAILECKNDYQIGITAPGFPGMIMGRSQKLSISFTYGMMDLVDFFIEEIKDQKCRREDHWEPLYLREERVIRKKKGEVNLYFYESSSGVLERRESQKKEINDGLYFSMAWSCQKNGAASNLNSFVNLWSASNVEEAGKIARDVTLSCNWVLADKEGGIGYQQSGRLPRRMRCGLFPLPAWKKENLWNGFVPGSELSSQYNPKSGFVVSANDDKNCRALPVSITVPYSPYRYERIYTILSQKKKFTVEEMKDLQGDLYSLQAQAYLSQMREWIPDTPAGQLLKEWDCCYDKNSKGATLFEAFYFNILIDVFSKFFGKKAWTHILTRQSLLVFTHGFFDKVLLSDDASWFGDEGKKECFKRILLTTLDQFHEIPPWGEKNSFMMHNLYFKGKFPKFLGFDIGPLKMPGSRATVAASFVIKERKRIFAAGASYRMVTDLASQELFTALAGGVSEKRHSKYYTSDIKRWLNFEYKKLTI